MTRVPPKAKDMKVRITSKKMEVLEDDGHRISLQVVMFLWLFSLFVFKLSTDVKTERMTKASLHHLVLLFYHPSQHWKMRLDLF